MTAPGAFVIFGATGDLARRMLFPSLYFLDMDGLLPGPLKIIGAARSKLSDDQFRAEVEKAVRERAGSFFSKEAWEHFAKRLTYSGGEAGDAAGLGGALQRAGVDAREGEVRQARDQGAGFGFALFGVVQDLLD